MIRHAGKAIEGTETVMTYATMRPAITMAATAAAKPTTLAITVVISIASLLGKGTGNAMLAATIQRVRMIMAIASYPEIAAAALEITTTATVTEAPPLLLRLTAKRRRMWKTRDQRSSTAVSTLHWLSHVLGSSSKISIGRLI